MHLTSNLDVNPVILAPLRSSRYLQCKRCRNLLYGTLGGARSCICPKGRLEYGTREMVTRICFSFWVWHLAAGWNLLKCSCYDVIILLKDIQWLFFVHQLKLLLFYSMTSTSLFCLIWDRATGRGRRGLNVMLDILNRFSRKHDSITKSLCCTPENSTMLLINCAPI